MQTQLSKLENTVGTNTKNNNPTRRNNNKINTGRNYLWTHLHTLHSSEHLNFPNK